MCDTLAALPAFTAGGALIFAKNSDRERNEAQAVEWTPAARHPPDAILRATYIALPQARETHACLICRPFWMWGAEMGANAHGVVIGNEAVHATVKAPRPRALTGMDLVRLGLERAASAAQAVEVITTLLERHGQGGDCGHLARFYYHNSFLIADAAQAFVLETVGRWWAVERVTDARAISNALTIGAGHSALSGALAAEARAQGWTGDGGRFDFAAVLADDSREAVSSPRGRCARAGALLASRRGRLTVPRVMAILRDHGPEPGKGPWTPATAPTRTICMHAAEGARRSQTVGSLVSQPGRAGGVHWVTAGAAPCLSVFKPVVFPAGLPDQGPSPDDRDDGRSRWWRHERLHRAVLLDYGRWAPAFALERDRLEASFVARIDGALARGDSVADLSALTAECWREADAFEASFLSRVRREARAPAPRAYRQSWTRLNQIAGHSPHPPRSHETA